MLSLLLILFVSFVNVTADNKKCVHLQSIIMEEDVCDPLIVDLINARVMQRLKDIDQSGIAHYFHDIKPYSRFDHSIGVYHLVKKYGGSYVQQIAALLHDSSHTVFSHTGDWVFRDVGDYFGNKSYQDQIHLWYLQKQGVPDLINGQEFKLEDLDPDNRLHTHLEQHYPDMSADRIEYNLHTGLIFNIITQDEVAEILSFLRFENDKWFFIDIASAEKFANLSLKFTVDFWASHFNEALNLWGANILKRALKINLITRDDIHFGIDEKVLEKIKQSDDVEIQYYLKLLKNEKTSWTKAQKPNCTHYRKAKFRGIDPLVLRNEKYIRLTETSPSFKKNYDSAKKLVEQGICISFDEFKDD